jgi:hypothetical protein
MRAMYNPSRMTVIQNATKKLVEKINSCCPNVIFHGITDAKRGLKCSLCGSATNSTLSFIYTCQDCQYTKEEMHPHKKQPKTLCIVTIAIHNVFESFRAVAKLKKTQLSLVYL